MFGAMLSMVCYSMYRYVAENQVHHVVTVPPYLFLKESAS
ncbi:hypothetical protein BN2476_2170003 [Paraburkholderia piptadeniae]|uniref:Uncharacterized protein n=1 Tax=Paraburkholderia piptadeniae TaxID=1701573 RepID=A0A1N7SXT1_9BURK|nr:hypothetical protein BN2476_2170003 [Paraburkholderia piptadeniae]